MSDAGSDTSSEYSLYGELDEIQAGLKTVASDLAATQGRVAALEGERAFCRVFHCGVLVVSLGAAIAFRALRGRC